MHYNFLFLLSVLPVNAATGINCRGSSDCTQVSDAIGSLYHAFLNKYSDDDDITRAQTGQALGCTNAAGGFPGAICAMWEYGSASGTLYDAAMYLNELGKHGCKICGSDPLDGKDVSNGALVVNYVRHPCCAPHDEVCFCV